MVSLSASVGPEGRNRPDDVALVEYALARAKPTPKSAVRNYWSRDPLTGKYGAVLKVWMDQYAWDRSHRFSPRQEVPPKCHTGVNLLPGSRMAQDLEAVLGDKVRVVKDTPSVYEVTKKTWGPSDMIPPAVHKGLEDAGAGALLNRVSGALTALFEEEAIRLSLARVNLARVSPRAEASSVTEDGSGLTFTTSAMVWVPNAGGKPDSSAPTPAQVKDCITKCLKKYDLDTQSTVTDENISVRFVEGDLQNNRSVPVMEEVARWVHGQLRSNPNSPIGRKIKNLNERNISNLVRSLPDSIDIPINNTAGFVTGLSVQDLVNETTAFSALVEALQLWKDQVNSRKEWDFKAHSFEKKQGTQIKKDGKILSHVYDPVTKVSFQQDIWGNLHYGFVGRAIGFSGFVLLQGAGGAQLLSDVQDGRFKNIEASLRRLILDFKGFSSFDPPEDQVTVRFGIELYEKYGAKITFEEFLRELRVAKGRLPTR